MAATVSNSMEGLSTEIIILSNSDLIDRDATMYTDAVVAHRYSHGAGYLAHRHLGTDHAAAGWS